MRATFLAKRREGMDVLKAVCEARDVSETYVLGPSHVRALVDVRREIAFNLRCLGWSLPQIGCLLRRDHTTILHMLKEGEAREDALFAKRVITASWRAA